MDMKSRGLAVGLVPTMGALHEGHLSLMRAARKDNDHVVASIFVNPIQFDRKDDLEKYPRDLAGDAKLCESVGVDVLFCPEAAAMYPSGHLTYVTVKPLSEKLCGAHRPGHFHGVATVVLKLFNLVQPTRAYFGQKDAQQALIIQRMVKDLDVPVEIKVMPIVREADGLAMSSRNARLDADARQRAKSLFTALKTAQNLFEGGEDKTEVAIAAMRDILMDAGARIDYIAVVDAQTLEPLPRLKAGALVAIAAWIGPVRLIDNGVLISPIQK